MYKVVRCIREKAGKFTESEHEVVLEVPLAITVNGRHALTVMTSPVMLTGTGYRASLYRAYHPRT